MWLCSTVRALALCADRYYLNSQSLDVHYLLLCYWTTNSVFACMLGSDFLELRAAIAGLSGVQLLIHRLLLQQPGLKPFRSS